MIPPKIPTRMYNARLSFSDTPRSGDVMTSTVNNGVGAGVDIFYFVNFFLGHKTIYGLSLFFNLGIYSSQKLPILAITDGEIFGFTLLARTFNSSTTACRRPATFLSKNSASSSSISSSFLFVESIIRSAFAR